MRGTALRSSFVVGLLTTTVCSVAFVRSPKLDPHSDRVACSTWPPIVDTIVAVAAAVVIAKYLPLGPVTDDDLVPLALGDAVLGASAVLWLERAERLCRLRRATTPSIRRTSSA